MNSKNKQLINTSLEMYKGKQRKVIIKEGIEYCKESDLLEIINNIFSTSISQKYIYIKDINDISYRIQVLNKIETDKEATVYEINIVKHQLEYTKIWQNKKNKYEKQVYVNKKIKHYINNLGIVHAQKAHAEDKVISEYINLRQFLKDNPHKFDEIKLYQKGSNDKFHEFRHKNLFSKYKDEISDFEKITYFERLDNNMLQVRHKLDEKILEFNQENMGLLERKNARFFAKEVYEKKGIFSNAEILKSLGSLNIYIKVENVLSKDNKLIWSKVLIEDMDIRTLEKTFNYEYKNKKERLKNVQLKYLSKRDKKRRKRREQKRFINEGLNEYYELQL